jgi:RNA polymerase sigma-70 factor, ECF subfamily
LPGDERGRAPGLGPWDEGRFHRLFLERYAEIHRLLARITGSRADADDLAQEVFLRCWTRGPAELGAAGEEGDQRLRAWLRRTALNLGLNAVRDRRRREDRHRESGPMPAERQADLPDAWREAKEEAGQVRRVLGRLRPRDAELLHLRHAGLSYRELAETLRLAPGSVGTLLARAEAQFLRLWSRGSREGERRIEVADRARLETHFGKSHRRNRHAGQAGNVD